MSRVYRSRQLNKWTVRRPHVELQARAEVVRGECLAERADVVALTLDRQQGRAPYALRGNCTAAPLEPPLRERRFLEHAQYRIEVELGGKIGNGEILIVERTRRVGILGVAIDQAVVEAAKRFDMTIEIHSGASVEIHTGAERDAAGSASHVSTTSDGHDTPRR